MNVFFDVDHTIIDADDGLRPGVRELFARLRAGGHRVYLWSGLGARWEIVERHGLEDLVAGCFPKPLYAYERMLEPLGIDVRPEFAVDDHPHLVHAFGGCVVARYLRRDDADTEMARVYRVMGGLEGPPTPPALRTPAQPGSSASAVPGTAGPPARDAGGPSRDTARRDEGGSA